MSGGGRLRLMPRRIGARSSSSCSDADDVDDDDAVLPVLPVPPVLPGPGPGPAGGGSSAMLRRLGGSAGPRGRRCGNAMQTTDGRRGRVALTLSGDSDAAAADPAGAAAADDDKTDVGWH